MKILSIIKKFQVYHKDTNIRPLSILYTDILLSL